MADNDVVERQHRFVVAALCRMTGRLDIALDLAQDVFVKALAHAGGFRRDAQFTTWLYAIARNRCYDYFRARNGRREVSQDALGPATPLVDNAALRALELTEARRILFRLVKDALLDPAERRVFVLHYAAGVPLDVLTRRLGLGNRSGAKAQIVSARRKLGRAASRWRTRLASLTEPQGSMTP
jgi:RNA polymerase sigma-70 factor (ECF subfamily)